GRLVVVDRAKRMPRIGEGIFRTGAISSAARKSAFHALSELLPVIERHRPDAVDEEARLSYAGARARLGAELGRATLFDLGGGSLEAIVGDGQQIVHTATAPLGVLRAVVERPLSDPPTPRELRALEQWTRAAAGAFVASLGDVDLG